MSVVAVGPALDLDGPLPVAPRYSLLTVDGVLVADGDDGRWLNGVNVNGYPEDTPSTWEPCLTGTFRVKEEGGEHSEPRFDTVGLYLPVSCSAFNYANRFDELAARADRVLTATRSFAVENLLAAGADDSTNPFISDGNMDALASSAAVPPSEALSWLEEAIGATGRQGLIHAPPAVVAAWGFDKLETGDGLYTANGTPVAVGGGYSGIQPVGEASVDAGTSWAFATGPVEVRLSVQRVIDEDIANVLDTSNNDVTFRAEVFVLAEWDTALQAGVLVNWSP